MKRLLTWFLQGVITLVPVLVTGYVVVLVYVRLAALFAWVGEQLGTGLAPAIEGALGAIVTVALIVTVGALVSNVVGRTLMAWVDHTLERLPLIKLLYGSVRDLLGAFVGDKKSFDRPVVVALDGSGGARVIGFVTRDDLGFLGLPGEVAVYLPQSYNFAGNLLVLPRDRVQALACPASDVMTFLVSGGVSGK